MGDLATKREREKQVVSQMIALYCRKKHGGKNSFLPRHAPLDRYARQQRPLPLYGDENLLLQLPGALLPARYAGADSPGDAIFWAADVVLPSGDGNPPCHRNPTGETKIGGTT